MTTLQLDSERYFPDAGASRSHADPARPPAQRLQQRAGCSAANSRSTAVLVALCEAVEKPVAQAAQSTLEQMPVNTGPTGAHQPCDAGVVTRKAYRRSLSRARISCRTCCPTARPPIGSTCGLLLRRPCRRFTSASVSTCSASSAAPRLSRRSGKTRASIAIFCDPRSSSWSAAGSTSRAFRSLKRSWRA